MTDEHELYIATHTATHKPAAEHVHTFTMRDDMHSVTVTYHFTDINELGHPIVGDLIDDATFTLDGDSTVYSLADYMIG
jgi:hypothetical protein